MAGVFLPDCCATLLRNNHHLLRQSARELKEVTQFARTSDPTMEVRLVHGPVCRAHGRDCRIILFGKDRTTVPTSDVGQDAAALGRQYANRCPGMRQIYSQQPQFERNGTAKDAAPAQKAMTNRDQRSNRSDSSPTPDAERLFTSRCPI